MVLQLSVKSRELTGKKVAKLREQGLIPGVVYGPDREPVMVTVDRSALVKAYEQSGNNTIIHVNIDEGKAEYDVLIHEITNDPLKHFPEHVDFYCFKEGHKLNTEIPLNFIGVASTIKEHNAILVKQLEVLSVRCLPKDLVSSIDVDLSKIKNLDDTIQISDLDIPEGIELENALDDIVAGTMVTKEEVDVPVETEGELPEVEKKGKKEEAETEE